MIASKSFFKNTEKREKLSKLSENAYVFSADYAFIYLKNIRNKETGVYPYVFLRG